MIVDKEIHIPLILRNNKPNHIASWELLSHKSYCMNERMGVSLALI